MAQTPALLQFVRRDHKLTIGTHFRACAFSLGVFILAAGCTANSADGPTSIPVASVTATPSVVDPSTFAPSSNAAPASPSPSAVESSAPSSLDPAALEAADRAAIEAQWTELWEIYTILARMAADERKSSLVAVTSSPLTENLVEAARQANLDGVDNYGKVIHRLFWQTGVDGATTATIADCQDQSQAGTVRVSTGETLTTGRPRISLRGDFIKGDDGIWRARQIIDLGNSDC